MFVSDVHNPEREIEIIVVLMAVLQTFRGNNTSATQRLPSASYIAV
jgi:hypothetical protein